MADPRDPVPPTVVRSVAGAVPPTVVRGIDEATADVARGYFPDELLASYEVVAIAGSGTEADVWHARGRGDGKDVAVKVHRPGAPLDDALLGHLANPRFRRHVPELHGFGYAPTPHGRVGWVAMEYLPATLDVLMTDERSADSTLPAARAREILAELAATIRFWQDPDELDRTPIDVKPDNFGVRRKMPLELVVIDFGGVVRQTTTQHYGDVAAASAYMSPEGVIGMRLLASPWWSLGVIAYELATGTTRFRAPDDRLRDDRVLRRETALGEVDLSDAPDERWRLLLAGLLTRNPDERWGWDQVSSWLAGGSPPVAQPEIAGKREGKARAPITFRARNYWTPEDLAAALFDSPDIAASWLQTDADQLAQWVREDVADNLFDTRKYLTGIAARPNRAPLAILAFGAAYAPALTPRYRGTRVDAAGIDALCRAGPNSHDLLRELFEQEVLPVAARYRCAHPRCQSGQRCLVLDGLADEVPLITGQVAQAATDLTGTAATVAERDLARATATQLTLGQAAADPVAYVSRELGRARTDDPAWWPDLVRRARRANQNTVVGRVDLVTAITLDGRVRAERTRLQVAARGRRRAQIAAVRLVPAIALFAFLALALLNWSSSVISFAVSLGAGHLLSTGPDAAYLDQHVGRLAAWRVFDLLPLLVAAAVVSALPRLGRGVLAGTVTGLIAVGFAAVRVPAFPAPLAPGSVRTWLTSLAAAWHQFTGIAAVVICPVAAIICLVIAVRLSRRQEAANRVPWRLPRLPAAARRLLAVAITFVVLESVLWVLVVVKVTIFEPGLLRSAGSQAAHYQSGLLLACAVVALIAAIPRHGAFGLLVTGSIGAAAAALWGLPPFLGRYLWHPVAGTLLSGLASIWGTEAFWSAVVFAAPLAILGFLAAARFRTM